MKIYRGNKFTDSICETIATSSDLFCLGICNKFLRYLIDVSAWCRNVVDRNMNYFAWNNIDY